MKPLIFALATALPQYSSDQANIAQKLINMFKLEGKSASFIENVCAKTQIKKRYSVLQGIDDACEQDAFFNKNYLQNVPSTKMRNDVYIQEAPKLALKVARETLKQWGRDSKEITHVISVSCTGVMAPGIEFILQEELNLAQDVQRLGINFMGCFGAFRGLAVASSIAKESPKNRVLLVCTELCSLHLQSSLNPEILIGNAIFADGAAAIIVGSEKRDNEKALWSIEKCGSYALSKTQDKMTWTISNTGCVMKLTKDVPAIIESCAQKVVSSFLNSDNFNDITWAVHPGGKAIIEAIEKSCNLTKEQTKASWNVLSNYGNMSSATFLFVLNELVNDMKYNSNVIGLGFGPGLSLEAILLVKPD